MNALSLVVFFDGPYSGRYNDRSIYNQCELAVNRANFLSDEEKIIADGGFIGGLPLLVPFTKVDFDKAADAREKQAYVEFNQELGLNRSLVEHVIHFVKDRARTLTARWSKQRKKQGRYLKAAIILYNWTRRRRIHAVIHAQTDIE